MSLPIVAIVGRPNVGKSTLFNRLLGERLAITAEESGTTRDRLIVTMEWEGRAFAMIDTAGLDIRAGDPLQQAVMNQARLAIQEADVIVFVVDINVGVVTADAEVADVLRRSGKRVVLAANKADNPQREALVAEFFRLGLGEPLPISAHHNRGIGDLMDAVVAALPPAAPEEPEPATEQGMRLAVVGRPNVGKSMLINALLGQERVVVSDVPGTTRDSIDSIVRFGDKTVTLIDTAGIRRRGRIEVGVEKFSSFRAFRAIERADVAVLIVDPTELGSAQDTHVAGYVLDAFKGLIIVVNKWDLAEGTEATQEAVEAAIHSRFRFAPFAPILFTSALKRTGLRQVLETASFVYSERMKRVSTGALNRVVERAIGDQLPRSIGPARLHILYVTQPSVNPPTFVFFVNNPKLLHFAYQRYLENRLRGEFGFVGTPIRLLFKAREER